MSGYFGIPLRNGLPLGLGTVISLRSGASWTPLTLFLAGEQGGWYDPTDLTTMFQDSSGTTPVTAVEQPVGRWLDKSGRGNHLIQPTSASRPTYSKRYNLLTRTEELTNAVWAADQVSISAGAGIAPDGTNTAFKLTPSTVNGIHQTTHPSVTGVLGTSYTWRWWIKAAEYQNAAIWFNGEGKGLYINAATGVITNQSAGITVVENVDVGAGWRRVAISVTQTVASAVPAIYNVDNAGSISFAGTGTAGILVWHPDYRRTIHTQMGMPAYQRVTTATDYDETGFLPRLRFDGADDSMYSAASVDFSTSDAMTIMAGVTKLSDAALGMLMELSANLSLNSGVFWLLAPLNTGASGDFDFSFKGTNQIQVNSGTRTAPARAVLTATDDISSDAAVLRYNGVQVAASSGDQGTGNFGNHVLYVGRRNNANLPFNGDIFQLIVRGALTSGADLTSAEQYVAARTGVTL